jgi:hypothetical protein
MWLMLDAISLIISRDRLFIWWLEGKPTLQQPYFPL